MIKTLVDERELLAEIAGGDKRSFEYLFKLHHKSMFSFSKRVTRSEELAKEVVQDIFLRIWLNREKLVEIENLGAYLNTLVRNECFKTLRKLNQEFKSNEVYKTRHSESDYSTEREIDYRETESILNSAIATLSPQQKAVYVLCHQEGLKYEEAASQLGLSAQTVHSYMKDALRKIRSHFKSHAIEYSAFIICLFK